MVMQNIVIRQIRRTWWFQNRWPFTLYQKFMKGMDFSDQMVQYYLIHQRSWTWFFPPIFLPSAGQHPRFLWWRSLFWVMLLQRASGHPSSTLWRMSLTSWPQPLSPELHLMVMCLERQRLTKRLSGSLERGRSTPSVNRNQVTSVQEQQDLVMSDAKSLATCIARQNTCATTTSMKMVHLKMAISMLKLVKMRQWQWPWCRDGNKRAADGNDHGVDGNSKAGGGNDHGVKMTTIRQQAAMAMV